MLGLSITSLGLGVGQTNSGISVFNAAALSNWQAAVANRESAPAVLVVSGDSLAEGFNASGIGSRWIDNLRDELYAKYPVSGVTPPASSYVPTFKGNNTAAMTLIGSPVPTSFFNSFGAGLRASVTATIGSGYEVTMDCTSISLHYIRTVGGGTLQVEAFISGAYTVVGTFSTAGALNSQVWNSGAFSGAATKIKITNTTAANTYVEGVRFYNGDEAKGFHIIDASHFGYNINSYATAGIGSAYAIYGYLDFMQPHLVILPIIANDYYAQTATATYKSSFQTALSMIRQRRAGQQVMLLAYAARGDVVAPGITYTEYETANREIAAADTAGPGSTSAVAYMSIRGPFPDCTLSPTAVQAEYDADRVHWTDTGHSLGGQLVSTVL